MPLEYLVAMRMAEKLGLRALDLLHIAYATLMKEEIDAFITGDEEILEERDGIKNISGVEIASVQEVAKI
ncbi:MAG: type II toxin-antitoxin system VapC family toxin [Candidatus Verstraetearchaeota archaeon]|nr:type II toxin-antitoxin system VapC family toxin [Candidatus Verstraetearchaeota archaeon]